MASLKKEFKNVMTLYYLMKLDKKVPTDHKKIKARQNRLVHKTMKRAYDHVPFYRAKFEECGLTPDDFHSAEDLVKFPVMDRAELRKWMQEEFDAHPDKVKDWVVYATSGSSGVPLKSWYERIISVPHSWQRSRKRLLHSASASSSRSA